MTETEETINELVRLTDKDTIDWKTTKEGHFCYLFDEKIWLREDRLNIVIGDGESTELPLSEVKLLMICAAITDQKDRRLVPFLDKLEEL